jgi:polyhydroxyalkanoate synthesis regulator phasin
MTRSRTSRKRTGIVGYLGNIVDDTKDYIDDMLDRGREVDRDVRSTARRVLRDDRDDDLDGDSPADIRALRRELDDLAEKVEELAAARSGQSAHAPARKGA